MATPATLRTQPHAAPKKQSGAGVVFRAAVYGGSGYADGNLSILDGLRRDHFPIQLVPMGPQEDTAGLLHLNHRRELERLQKARLNLGASLLYQCAPAIDFETQVETRVRVGRTTFETDRIPDGWRECCNAMDEVWVTSEFNRETFLRGGVEERRLRVMHEGLDTKVYRPGLTPLKIPNLRGFNFLSIFDWIDRKGPDVLLKAFTQAFKADDDVTLILKVHKFDDPSANLEEMLLYFLERTLRVKLEDIAPILLLRGLLPASDMPRLYATASAFVLPSRGEGWGRPYMEAASSQLPVLATRWSGQVDFLDDENSYLIDIEGEMPVPRTSDREVYIGHRWAEPSAEHLAQLMRQVASQPKEARGRALRARQDMVTKWDTRVIAPHWNSEFRRLLQ